MTDRKLKALGAHVFAGGFTHGVQQAGWDVVAQLEVHDFGLETARARWGVECINDAGADWPSYDPDEVLLLFSNPRCTAFSTVTSGERYRKSNAHGAFGKQTCDVMQTVSYGIQHRFPFIVWESVQQAYHAAGADLVKLLVHEKFVPAGYRVAHLFINAATFGNSQWRKRYFMVAYLPPYKFNIQPPVLAEHYTTLFDAIGHMRDVEGREHCFREGGYGPDSCRQLTENDRHVIKALPTGWSHNTLATHGYHLLSQRDKDKWDFRESDMPFSLHCLKRLSFLGPSPTMFSSSDHWVHPERDRCVTVGELTAIMGWPADCIPIGPKPCAQLCKGVCPEVARWLARQVQLSIEGHWGTDDWESSFNDQNATWEGRDTAGTAEKVIDMTRYHPKRYDAEKYERVGVRHFNVGPDGRPIKPWKEIREQNLRVRIAG